MRVLFCFLMLVGSALGQVPCPDGQCRVNPLPTQDWRATAPAQRQQAVANPAIVRVGSRYGQITDYGTGTIIGRLGKVAHVLTCWHTLRDGGAKDVFVLTGGRRYPANVLHTDKTWDVAVLVIQDPGITPIPLADVGPIKGQAISVAGHGSGNYRQVSARMIGFSAPRPGVPFELMSVGVGSRSGDSGGPVLYGGRVVGLVSTTDAHYSYGPCLPRLRAILRCVLPPYPNRPGVIVPKPVVVLPVIPSTPPVSTIPEINYDLLAAAIINRLDMEMLRGPEGPRGLPGNDGQTGLTGNAGPTPAINIEDLAIEVTRKLSPVVLEIHHPDGKVFTQAKPLGVPLRIRLVPVSE